MRRARFGIVGLLAVMLPANLLWVFFACALQCMAAAGPACLEHDRGAACCEAGADAACEATEVSCAHRACTIVVERGVLGGGDHRPRTASPASLPVGLCVAFVEPGHESRHASPLAHAPPRPRPLDRLPILLI